MGMVAWVMNLDFAASEAAALPVVISAATAGWLRRLNVPRRVRLPVPVAAALHTEVMAREEGVSVSPAADAREMRQAIRGLERELGRQEAWVQALIPQIQAAWALFQQQQQQAVELLALVLLLDDS